MLNTLKVKNYNNQELSNTDYIRFVYCLIFANKDFAKEIIEDLVFLFATIEKISTTHQIDLFLALKMMIKFRFDDDLKKKEELLEMVIKSIHQSRHDEINGYEVEQKSIDELKADYATLKAEMDRTISEMDRTISEKDNAIDNLRNELDEKKEWIRKAEIVLKENHISY